MKLAICNNILVKYIFIIINFHEYSMMYVFFQANDTLSNRSLSREFCRVKLEPFKPYSTFACDLQDDFSNRDVKTFIENVIDETSTVSGTNKP